MSKTTQRPKPRGTAADPLAGLRGEWDALVARMRTPEAKTAGDALFRATGEELGALAEKHARAVATRKTERK